MKAESVNTMLQLVKRLEEMPAAAGDVFVGFDGSVEEYYELSATVDGTRKEITTRKMLASCLERDDVSFVKRLVSRTLTGGSIDFARTLAALGVRSHCVGPFRHSSATLPSMSGFDLRCIGDAAVKETFGPDALDIHLLNATESDGPAWASIRASSLNSLSTAAIRSTVTVMLGWPAMRNALDIWEGFIEDVVIPSGRKDFTFLFAPGSPLHSSIEETDELVDLINSFTAFGKVWVVVTEENADHILCSLTGKPVGKSIRTEPSDTTVHLGQMLQVDHLVVKGNGRAYVYEGHAVTLVESGSVIAQEKFPIGHYVAGVTTGLLSGLSAEESVLLGLVTYGAFHEDHLIPGQHAILNYARYCLRNLGAGADRTLAGV
jgi:hypothetical protein